MPSVYNICQAKYLQPCYTKYLQPLLGQVSTTFIRPLNISTTLLDQLSTTVLGQLSPMYQFPCLQTTLLYKVCTTFHGVSGDVSTTWLDHMSTFIYEAKLVRTFYHLTFLCLLLLTRFMLFGWLSIKLLYWTVHLFVKVAVHFALFNVCCKCVLQVASTL